MYRSARHSGPSRTGSPPAWRADPDGVELRAIGARDRRGRFLGRLLGIAQHPDILAAAAALHGDDLRMRIGCEARETARHDLVALRRGDGIDADAERARRETVGIFRIPDGCLRERQMLLRHEGMRPRAHPRDQRLALLARGRCRTGLLALIRKCRLDHQPREIAHHGIEGGRLAAPPGRHRREGQPFADELLGDGGQESEPRRGFEHARAERVGDGDVALADRARAIPARPAPSRRAAPPDRKNHRRACAEWRARASSPPESSRTRSRRAR